MTTQVEPEDLLAAAQQIGGGTTGTTPFNGISPQTATNTLRFGGNGISATDTATALSTATSAALTAIEVVRSRIGEWNSILTVSAEAFETAEDVSTRRLQALGDFNTPPRA